MHVLPKMQIKMIEACEPGELVRLSWRGNPLSIVVRATSPERRFIVFLESVRQNAWPLFVPSDEDGWSVLSYGHNWEIELNQNGPKEIGASRLWNANGAVIVDGTRFLMRAAPAEHCRIYHSILFNLTTGCLGTVPRSDEAAIFLHWNLRLSDGEREKPPPLVTHEPTLAQS